MLFRLHAQCSYAYLVNAVLVFGFCWVFLTFYAQNPGQHYMDIHVQVQEVSESDYL